MRLQKPLNTTHTNARTQWLNVCAEKSLDEGDRGGEHVQEAGRSGADSASSEHKRKVNAVAFRRPRECRTNRIETLKTPKSAFKVIRK